MDGADAAARERTVIRALDRGPPPADHAVRQRRGQHDAGAIRRVREPAQLGGADQRARTVERERARAAEQVERDREADVVAALGDARAASPRSPRFVRSERGASPAAAADARGAR
jgi:hypothetical protein